MEPMYPVWETCLCGHLEHFFFFKETSCGKAQKQKCQTCPGLPTLEGPWNPRSDLTPESPCSVWSPGSIRVCWCCCLWAHSKLRFCLVIWTLFLTLGDFEKASFGNVLEQEPKFFSLIFWTYKTGIYCVPQRWFSTSTPTAVLPLGELHPESGRDCCVCQIRTHVHAHFDSRKRSH